MIGPRQPSMKPPCFSLFEPATAQVDGGGIAERARAVRVMLRWCTVHGLTIQSQLAKLFLNNLHEVEQGQWFHFCENASGAVPRATEECSCLVAWQLASFIGTMPVTMRFAQPPPSPNKAGLPVDAAPVLEDQRLGTSSLHSSLHSSFPRCDSPGKPGKCVTPRPRRGSARTLSPHGSPRKIPRISHALPTGSTPRSVTPRSNAGSTVVPPRRSSPRAPDTTPRTARATSSRYSSVAVSAASTPPSSSRQLFTREYDCRASNGGGETWQQWPPTPPQQWQPTPLQLAQTPP